MVKRVIKVLVYESDNEEALSKHLAQTKADGLHQFHSGVNLTIHIVEDTRASKEIAEATIKNIEQALLDNEGNE